MIYLKFQIRLFFEYYSMEDNSVQSRLSQTALYLLGTAQVKANMIEQQVLSILNSKYVYNDLKKLIKTGIHTLDNIEHIFNQIGTKRMYHVIKRITHSLNTICNQLIQNLEKQKSKMPIPLMYEEKVCTSAKNVNGTSKKIIDFQSTYKQKLNKLGGVCIYNQNYKRKIDQKSLIDNNKNGQKKQKTKEDQQQDQKTFKKKLFQKMKGQLKELEEDLYSPFPDEVSTFIIFEKKFLQSFNHFSHAQNIQQLANYLQNSQLSAIQLLSKSKDMSQEISKYRVEIENLMRETVIKTKERNENISQKFDEILQKFIIKRIEIYKKTMQKVNVYNKMIKQRQVSRVSIGVQTNVKQLSTIKNIQRRMFEIQTKYRIKEEQKTKNSKNLLDKLNNQKNYLTSEITKLKIVEKISQEELQKIRKQNKELLQSLRKEKNKNQKLNLLYDQIKDVNPDESHQLKKKNSGRLSILSKIPAPLLEQKISENQKIVQFNQKSDENYENQEQTENKISEEKYQQKQELKLKKVKGQTISISELQQQINKKQSIEMDILEIKEPQQYQTASKRMIRKPFYEQNSLRFLTKKKVIYQQNTLSKSSQLISQIKNDWNQKKQNYIQKALKTENNLKQQKQSSIFIKQKSPVALPSKKNINNKKLQKVVKQNRKQKESPKNDGSKTYKQQGHSINNEQIFDGQQSYQIKLNLVNEEENQVSKQPKLIKTFQKNEKKTRTKYQFPILNKKPHQKKLKTQIQSESYSQKVSLQFTHLYSLTFNKGDTLNFNSKIDIYNKESPEQRNIFKNKQYSGQFASERRIQKNNYILFKDKQNTSPLTYNRQILKELKFYEQMCRKNQVPGQGMESQEKKIIRLGKKQLRSLHIYKERSYSNSSDINLINQNNLSSFILNVKSLMKEDKNFVKSQKIQKIDFETKKKLIKQLLIQGIKTRQLKQTTSFCLNNQNIRQSSKYSSIKIKEGEKLKKIRKRQRDRKRQANSFHKKREQMEIGLPQINIKHIF